MTGAETAVAVLAFLLVAFLAAMLWLRWDDVRRIK